MKPRILWCGEFSQLKTGYAVYAHEVMSRWFATNKYELAEHASYAHHSDPRTQNVPWQLYTNLPDSDNQEQVNQYNSSPTNQFGEWRFEDICIDFKPHFVVSILDFWMCLVKDSFIVTYSGIKNIENIKVGDLVLTRTGKYQKVIQTFKRETFEHINVIKPSHCLFEVRLTDNHPVLCIPKEKRENCTFPKIEPQWINSQDIKHNDLVAYPIDNFGTNELSLDMCRLIGYYTAEGCLMYSGKKINNKLSGVQFSFNSNEKEYIKDIKNIIKKIYNREITLKIIGNAAIIRICHKQIAQDMETYAGSLSGEKQWNDFILHMNHDCCKHLLCGLLRGDGGYYERRATYCTKSKQLAFQVFRLCLRFGILPSFNKNNNMCNNKTFYRYIFSFAGNSLEGFINIYNLYNTPIPLAKRIHNNMAFLSVREVWDYTRPEEVYNLQVENDESYVSSFCVHNCSHQYRSPLRPYYNLTQMPTCDAYPQNEEWISTYESADGVFTYQDWSKQVLDFESAGKIKTLGSASPAADNAFQPMDREAIKRAVGLSEYKIIGTVMRNQRRKLFPDLFGAFKMFLEMSKRSDILLYCHTSYPDMGWDIPKLLLQYGLSSKVLFTYVCRECGHAYPNFFNDALMECKRCKKMSAAVSNVQQGVDNKVLAAIYNLFDLYTQWSNSEGFSIPLVEAGACGVPVIAVDYSAMSDNVRKLGGIPIKPIALTMELETGCFRAVPDNDALIDKFDLFFNKLTEEQRLALRAETRKKYLENYSWDTTAKKWENYFDSVNIEYYEKMWHTPPQFTNIPTDYPKGLSNPAFAKWLITFCLGEPRYLNSYMESRLIRDLNYEVTNMGIAGMYFNDQSALFSKPMWQSFSQEVAFRHFCELGNRKNFWEKKRWTAIQSAGK